MTNEPTTVFCVGHTNVGAHGTGQAMHFETRAQRKGVTWALGINANLLDDIAVRWVRHVPASFHARFNTTACHYHYAIRNHRLRPAVLDHNVMHFHQPLGTEHM